MQKTFLGYSYAPESLDEKTRELVLLSASIVARCKP